MMNSKPGVFLAALVFMLTLSGCPELRWERQNVVIKTALDKDEIRALVTYEGLHVSGSSSEDIPDEAKTKLIDLFYRKESFCLTGLWPLWPLSSCFDLAPSAARAQDSERSKLNRMNQSHVAIRKSGFFLNPDGRLSGWQQITIRNAGKYLEAANALVSDGLSEWAGQTLQARLDANRETESDGTASDPWDDLTLVMLQRAARDRHQWIGVEPGRISFTMIGSPEFFVRVKRLMLNPPEMEEIRQFFAHAAVRADDDAAWDPKAHEKLLRSLKDLETRSKQFSKSPWSFDQRRNRVTISLGYGDNEPIRFGLGDVSMKKGDLEGQLHEFARSLRVPLRKRASVEDVISEFLASADR